ncbi:hypothetical protein PUY80_02190 [Plantibacter flavus]|uniref:DUF7882 family protein n=1 Tax=Plantibacter flavus TaxID=150123 RepID=UPI00237821B6|nr:hypothetical protein [Plantibacter flavus]MDD9151372.1 hypothetical protein [Plantibacter flavus]
MIDRADDDRRLGNMGTLRYGNEALELEDRTLAHVQMVVVSKLRKGEAFLLSWTIDPAHGSGRYAIWIETGVPIVFRFTGSRPVALNRTWLQAMLDRTYTPAGLELMPETDYPELSAHN